MTCIQTAVGHAVAAAVIVLAAIGFTLVSYFGLLAWALLVGKPIGGALALPFMLLAAVVGSCVAILLVLFPSTLVSHITCRLLNWPLLAEIPIAALASVLISLAVGVVAGWLYGTVEQGIRLAAVSELGLLVPLGLYWWSLQGTTGLLRFAQNCWRCVAKRYGLVADEGAG